MVDIVLPRAVGSTGPAATITVNSVTTGAPWTAASVTNVGTSTAAAFDFVIPQGLPGDPPVLSVAGKTGDVTLVKADVGLASVDNTSDANKPVSTATQTALDLKASISDVLNTQTGTTYTLQASDNGKVVELGNAAAITLTIPVLTAGFNCLVRQTAAGVPTFTASDTTLRNRQSHTKLAGQWAEASISYRTPTEVVISGDTAT